MAEGQQDEKIPASPDILGDPHKALRNPSQIEKRVLEEIQIGKRSLGVKIPPSDWTPPAKK